MSTNPLKHLKNKESFRKVSITSVNRTINWRALLIGFICLKFLFMSSTCELFYQRIQKSVKYSKCVAHINWGHWRQIPLLLCNLILKFITKCSGCESRQRSWINLHTKIYWKDIDARANQINSVVDIADCLPATVAMNI